MTTLRQSMQQANVGDAERWLSLIGGTALLLYGLRCRSFGGLGLAFLGGNLVYRGATGHCGLYEALGVNTAAQLPPYKRAVKVEKTITVNAAPDTVYRFWRDLENLPRFMRHLESVRTTDTARSHWVAKGPAGTTVEWDAEIIHEVENELIAWQSLANADVYNSGSVHFRPAPGGRGTEVHVVVRYTPPAGALGRAFAKLFGEEPGQQLEEDLRRFKQIIETGEIPTTAGQPSGRGAMTQPRETVMSLATLR
ncbi:MAG: SRPBCC family protein [Thermodesulfobacteriota bacterium]